jgi:uncharacterized protein
MCPSVLEMLRRRAAPTGIALVLGASILAPSHILAQPSPAEGSWRGVLAPMAGVELRLVFHVGTDDAGLLTATMDSPDQGVTGIPVQQATFLDGELDLQMPQMQARYRGRLAHPDTIRGEWSQAGQSFPLVLARMQEGEEGVRRPQHPTPPFPYRVEEVRYPNPGAGISLAGTLTVPEGEGPFPAVALITGSGAQDRDETIFGHKPFWVLADHLTRSGIAVLRSDDRGVGESEGDFAAATSFDFAGDAASAVAWLRDRPEIDPDRVGLVGHSEGGLIAPIVSVEHGSVAFLVLLAGPGLPGEEILRLQAAAVARAMGSDEAAIAESARLQQLLFDAIREEEDRDARTARLEAMLREWIEATPAEERAAQGVPPGGEEAWVQAQLAMAASDWFRSFLMYDPGDHLRRVGVPVLALFGELDLQVPPDENVAAMDALVRESGHRDFTIRVLPGLNHLFQTAETGAPVEYARIEETFSVVALEAISAWILERVEG